MFASKGFRTAALLATLTMALSFVAIDTAEARRGGSFGSRGIRTERVIPATPTSPGVTNPVNRTMTQPGSTRNTTAAAPNARPSLFGGIGGAILGGFLFSGLFGLLFGYGFGGFGGMLALLFQVVLVAVVVSLLFRWLGRRQQPAMAGGAPGNGPTPFEARSFGLGGGSSDRTPRSNASQRAGRRDEVGISDRDLDSFEQRLQELQAAYSREDYDGLRRITTPEVMSYLAEELGANASQGLRNEVFEVQLLGGDIAEAWREADAEYATVAMRYESRDVTRNRATGEIVAGEDRVSETTEVWTFTRRPGAPWLVSAIQEA